MILGWLKRVTFIVHFIYFIIISAPVADTWWIVPLGRTKWEGQTYPNMFSIQRSRS